MQRIYFLAIFRYHTGFYICNGEYWLKIYLYIRGHNDISDIPWHDTERRPLMAPS